MIILLTGPSAIGKTTHGRICASWLAECEWINLDNAVTSRNRIATAYESAVKFGLEKFLSDCRSKFRALDRNRGIEAAGAGCPTMVIRIQDNCLDGPVGNMIHDAATS